jgi:Tfp pilus assembly protein PilN
MIQLNLLPDIKVTYIKAKKAKRMVIGIAVLAVAVSLTLLVVMASAAVFQKKHISDLNKDIKSYETNLQSTDDLAKILTIQNQLNSLPGLYEQRPVTSRLFGYVQATTPTQVSIAKLTLDFSESSLSVEGTADSLESVNRYVDTLKFTTFTVKDSDEKKNAFTNVILSSFNRDSKAAVYTVTFNFEPMIFDSSKEVTLNVPKTITTRSETELPSGVFDTKGTN